MSDGDKEVKLMITEANLKKETLIKDANKESDAFLESNKKTAELDAINYNSQYILEQNIKNRDLLLAKKQEILNQIFSKAIDNLSDLPANEYKDFLIKYLSGLNLIGDETIFVPKKYKGINTKEVNESLKSKYNNPNFIIDAETRDIKNGFVISKAGFENNNTFEALIEYYRDNLEKEIIDIII